MALPTIAGVFRVAMIWNQINGITPVNVFHVQAAAGSVTDIGEAIFDAFQVDQFSCLPVGFRCNELDITPLDGASGSTSVADPGVSHAVGGQTADAIAGEAVVVSFKTGLAGPRHRGRIFIGPVAENVAQGGLFGGDTAALSSIWADWQAALQGGAVEIDHVVASYVHSDATVVTNYVARAPLASARRRLLQVR